MKSPAVLVLATFVLWRHSALAQTWSPTGAPSNNWSAVACSAAGTQLIAASGGQTAFGYVYTSSDSGSNWTITSLPSNQWTSVACSADGTAFAAGAILSGAYFSTNAGTNWSAPIFPGIPTTVAVSGDGSLWALPFGGSLYRSTNFGASWITNHSPFFDCGALAISADGRLVNIGRNTGYVAYSTNSAVVWAGSNLLSGNISSFSSSADGHNVICLGSGVYHSTNSGRTWITNTLSPSTGWLASASSADGAKLLIAGQGRIYSSANFGQLWTSNSVPSLSWTGIASSADGCVLFAAASNGGILISRTNPAPVLNVAPSKNGIVLSWTIPSLTFELDQSSDLSSNQWSQMLNAPTFVPTNLQYRLSLNALDPQAFFRLKGQP